MEVYRPQCGSSRDIHDPHMAWNREHTWAVQCQGWSRRQADVATMVRAAEWAYTRLSYNGEPLDEGTYLEVGPAAMAALQQNLVPSFTDVVNGADVRIDLPVRIATDLPPHGWRLVIDQGVIRQ